MLTLRPYQEEVKAAVYRHLRTRNDNPCAVVPTAGGKTPIMASICQDAVTRWNSRVLILSHVKELLEQTADKLQAVCPEVDFGIYSAGLKRRDRRQAVIVAGIQSVYQCACELDVFDLVMIDEAHFVPLEGDGMYRQFLRDAKVINPRVRVIGFTATPYRMKTGTICTSNGFLNHVCYEVGVRELIRDGYLSPLITKAGTTNIDTANLHVRDGDFAADEVENLMDQESLVQSACAEIVEHTADRNACLIFAASVKHGQHIVAALQQMRGVKCDFVCGATPVSQRDATIARFKSGKLRYLCNVNVLTTGFNAPHIDCVALLRPTMSSGLYYQMVGRGLRVHANKSDCLVLDFGGNVDRHGPVDQVRALECGGNGSSQAPRKECPNCQAMIAAGFAICSQCGHAFLPRTVQRHEPQASQAEILSRQVSTTNHRVQDVFYKVHTKWCAGPDDPKSLRVDYRVSEHEYRSEWICFEHDGFARHKAIAWWQRRSPDPVPDSAERALAIIEGGGLAQTLGITVRSVAGDPYERIVAYQLGTRPEPLPVDEFGGCDTGEVPF